MQTPLYTLWAEAAPSYIAFSIVHCTLGDVPIGGAALLLAFAARVASDSREVDSGQISLLNVRHHTLMRALQFRCLVVRRRLAALGLLAILALLVQPICSAYESGAGQSDHTAAYGAEDGVPCCSEIEAGALMAPPSAPSAKAILAGEGTLLLTHVAPAATVIPFRPPEPWSISPPRSLSYHARSARILR